MHMLLQSDLMSLHTQQVMKWDILNVIQILSILSNAVVTTSAAPTEGLTPSISDSQPPALVSIISNRISDREGVQRLCGFYRLFPGDPCMSPLPSLANVLADFPQYLIGGVL